MYLSPQHVVQAAWDWAELLPALWAALQALHSVQVGARGLFFWDQWAAQGKFFPGNDRRTSPTLQAQLKLLLALYLLICHWPKQVTWLSPKRRGRNVLSICLRGTRQTHGQALHQWAVTSSLLTEVKGRKWKMLNSFPVVVLLNDHKLGGLKPQKFILSQIQRPEVQNQDHLWVVIGLCYLQRL